MNLWVFLTRLISQIMLFIRVDKSEPWQTHCRNCRRRLVPEGQLCWCVRAIKVKTWETLNWSVWKYALGLILASRLNTRFISSLNRSYFHLEGCHRAWLSQAFFFFLRLGQHQTLSAQRRRTSEPEGRRLAVRGREISTKKHFMTKKWAKAGPLEKVNYVITSLKVCICLFHPSLTSFFICLFWTLRL